MTTPLCDCPDNIGWGTQADYVAAYGNATATITNAQGIYCVNGLPVVAPRGGFRTDWTEARVDNDPAGIVPIDTTPFDLRTGGGTVVVTDAVLTNPYPYPMQFMAFVELVLHCTAYDGQNVLMESVLKKDGTTTISTNNFRTIGYTSTASRILYGNWHYPLPELASGASMTIGHYPTVSVNIVGFSAFTLFQSAIRFIGGTTPPPY